MDFDTAVVGIGAMGKGIAARLASQGFKTAVWNRTHERSLEHGQTYCTAPCAELVEVAKALFIFISLPTSKEVADALEVLKPHLLRGTIIIDTTSGDPIEGGGLALEYSKLGVHILDAPVSGGPHGALAGTLTSMIGGDKESLCKARPRIQSYSKKIVHIGDAPGCGFAVKCMNNTLNSAHLLLATEAIIALKKFGIEPSLALQAINGSSGRSLSTESRLPDEVITRKFNYGFKYKLMLKDLKIAQSLIRAKCNDARLLKSAIILFDEASDTMSGQSDYTEVAKYVEHLENESIHLTEEPLVYVGMAADIVHHGHVKIIKHASKLGKVVIGLLTDAAIKSSKRTPISPYDERKIVVENIVGVSTVVEQATLDCRPNLLKLKPKYVVHGSDWMIAPRPEARQSVVDTLKGWSGKLIEPGNTSGITIEIISRLRE